jgi:hypothetical protein
MPGALQLGRVGEVRIRLTLAPAPGAAAHDAFLLDLRLPSPTERFDERPYLEALAPVLSLAEAPPRSCVVHVNRTHRVGEDGAGDAELVMVVTDAREHPLDSAAVDVVRSVLRGIVASHAAPRTRALGHDEAMSEARQRVQAGYPGTEGERLAVTDEEHMASAGMWSIGLALGSVARFEVLLGFVDGITQTTHIRRLPGSEVVDSVGTEGGGT